MEEAIHPKVFECADFTFYLERWNGIALLHLSLRKFSHSIFKKMKHEAHKLAEQEGRIFGYGEENSTYRLLEMAEFKYTDLTILNKNGPRRVLCLQHCQ